MIECNDNVFRLATAHTAYLFRITDFGHLEHMHYGAAVPLEETEPIAVPSAETDVLARMGREEILSAVHRMPEPGREVLYLRLLGSLSFAEIGAILGKTENWARVTYYRAKQLLIKEMRRE